MPPVTKVLEPSEPLDPVVLFVDDDVYTLRAYQNFFGRYALRILTAPSGLHALDLLTREKVHLIVSDYSMMGMTGIDLLHEAGRLYPAMGRILLTGEADSEVVLSAPCRVLTKSMDPALITRVILREVQRHV